MVKLHFPTSASGWLSPDFRGTFPHRSISWAILRALFGANAGDFAGKITIDGAMDTRDRKFGGHLMVEGASLTLFKIAIDNLSAKLNLKATDMEIEQLAMTHKNDSLSGQGKIDLTHEHNYSGTIEVRLNNLVDYLSIPRAVGEKANSIPADVQATIDCSKWDVRGVIHMPDSSPVSFTTNFALGIGTDWNAFRLSPLNYHTELSINLPCKSASVVSPTNFPRWHSEWKHFAFRNVGTSPHRWRHPVAERKADPAT